MRLVVDQAQRSFPSAAKREALLSAKCSATGLRAEEAAEGEGHTDIADYLGSECARLRLLARAVSGAISWDLVQELAETLGMGRNVDQGMTRAVSGSVDAKSGAVNEWLMVERRLGVADEWLTPFVPVGRRVRCALQLLAFAIGANLSTQAQSLSPLRTLCDDLQCVIAKLAQRSPRLWI